MKPRTILWSLSQDDIGHLSTALNPIRSYEEVAALLGFSESLVRQLETSALRKIAHAMVRFKENNDKL